MESYTVSRCICHDRSFDDILKYARERGYEEIEELQADDYCSCSCGLCIPYIEVALETGETEFEPGAFYKRNRSNGES